MATKQGRGSNEGKKTRKGERKRSHVHSPLDPDLRSPLQTLIESLKQLQQQVLCAPETLFESDQNALLPPLPDFQQACCLVSDSCTKLAVLFSSPPPPSPADCTTVTDKVEQSVTHMLATYHHIHPTYGEALHREVQKCSHSILQGTESLVSAIITTGSSTASQGLRGTGSVWEYCDTAVKLSRDNKVAVVKVLLSQLQLIRDGCREAEEVQVERGRGEEWGEGKGGVDEICEGVRGVQVDSEGDCDGPQEWTERERQLAEPCIQLIKQCSELAGEVCREVVTNGRCEVERQVRELDETAAAVLELSPLVDELVSELVAPLDWEVCTEVGGKLTSALSHLLHTTSSFHFCGDKWSCVRDRYSSSVTELRKQITATTTEP